MGCQVGSWWCSGGAGLHLRCSSRSPVLAFVGSDCDGDGHGSGHKVYKVSEQETKPAVYFVFLAIISV